MKLSLLFEDFKKRELFDFYALNAYDLKDDPYYKYLTDYLYNDIMRQFENLLKNRSDPGWFTSIDGQWLSVLPKSLNKAKTMPKDLAIDYMNSLTHHNGRIADYFDEKSWLPRALNILFVSKDPEHYWRYLSPYVKKRIWPYLKGDKSFKELSDMQLLASLIAKGSHVKIDEIGENVLRGRRRRPYYVHRPGGGFVDVGLTDYLPFIITYKGQNIYEVDLQYVKVIKPENEKVSIIHDTFIRSDWSLERIADDVINLDYYAMRQRVDESLKRKSRT